MLWLISENKSDFEGLIEELNSNGYKFEWFVKISEAFNRLKIESPEGILIDADHSEISCFEFCHPYELVYQTSLSFCRSKFSF